MCRGGSPASLICRLTALCVMFSSAAARVKLASRAALSNACKALREGMSLRIATLTS